MNIGSRVKELRLASGLTQQELAARTSLTKGFISLLERNKTSVSLDTLTQILTVLSESLSDFFSPEATRTIVFRKRERVLMEESDIAKFELLVPGSTNSLMDPCLLTLAPQEQLGPYEPHSGEEFGFVLRGNLLIGLGGMRYKAKRGDCFYYKAGHKHFLANTSVSETVVLLITSPPQM
jgi:transcriptional regulator with XRE-family HTH domain